MKDKDSLEKSSAKIKSDDPTDLVDKKTTKSD